MLQLLSVTIRYGNFNFRNSFLQFSFTAFPCTIFCPFLYFCQFTVDPSDSQSLLRGPLASGSRDYLKWSANPYTNTYTNKYFVIRRALKYFKWSAQQKSLGTPGLSNREQQQKNLSPTFVSKVEDVHFLRRQKWFLKYIFSLSLGKSLGLILWPLNPR